MSKNRISKFKREILAYYRAHGRDLPWRRTRDPYRILVSEFMLQQTQVSRVLKKYPEFIRRFPGFASLHAAPPREVLRAWQGLGYNRRALYLKALSDVVVNRYDGALPRDPKKLAALPGIGKATLGALRAFAFREPSAFIETNIRRAFIHAFFPRSRNVDDTALMKLVERAADRKNPREWYYALMDYGAHLGKSRSGAENPNRRSLRYRRQTAFRGSDRELRGKILRVLLREKEAKEKDLAGRLQYPIKRVRNVLRGMEREGFVVCNIGSARLV